MADKPNTALVPITETYRALSQDLSRFQRAMQQNVGQKGISAFDLDQIRIPTGGGLAWAVPTLEGVKPRETIEGILIYYTEPRAYYKVGFDQSGGGSPPDCSSQDGLVGTGDNGTGYGHHDCETCAMNQWGTATRNGAPARGKACKEGRALFLLTESGGLPLNLKLPPTSIKIIRKFVLRLASEGIPYREAILSFGLTQTKSQDGITFSAVVPKLVRQLTEEELARVDAYIDAMRPLLEQSAAAQAVGDDESYAAAS